MNDKEKLEILRKLDTKELTKNLHEAEDALETALREEASFKNLNFEYVASSTSDCHAVKQLLAELTHQIPETDGMGKKLTAAQKEAWLMKQRSENQELQGTISKQKEVDFLIDNNQIKVDMAKRRLEGIRAILALKTQQIAFLAS